MGEDKSRATLQKCRTETRIHFGWHSKNMDV
jgi:hypothetical protein